MFEWEGRSHPQSRIVCRCELTQEETISPLRVIGEATASL